MIDDDEWRFVIIAFFSGIGQGGYLKLAAAIDSTWLAENEQEKERKKRHE